MFDFWRVPAESSRFVLLSGCCFRIIEVHPTTCHESNDQTCWQCSPLTVLASLERNKHSDAQWGFWGMICDDMFFHSHSMTCNPSTIEVPWIRKSFWIRGSEFTLVPSKTLPMPRAHENRRSQCSEESRPGEALQRLLSLNTTWGDRTIRMPHNMQSYIDI